jgi:hypothetical protein
MRSSRLFFALLAAIALIHAAAATAATSINMDDPRRVVGREDDVRVDAQLIQDTVSPGSVIGVTYQIQNLSKNPVAVADKVMTASYDTDTQTITLAIGAEVPVDGSMPHVVVIAPGDKKVLRAGAVPQYSAAALRARGRTPRFVQVKVSILRDLVPFASVPYGSTLSDAQFEEWFESNDSIFLNTVPVSFSPGTGGSFGGKTADASSRY